MELKASWAERLNSASKASTSIPSGSTTSSGQQENGGFAPAEGICRVVVPANAGETSGLVGDKLDITASTTAGVPPGRVAGGSNAPAREKIGQFKAPQKLLHAQVFTHPSPAPKGHRIAPIKSCLMVPLSELSRRLVSSSCRTDMFFPPAWSSCQIFKSWVNAASELVSDQDSSCMRL